MTNAAAMLTWAAVVALLAAERDHVWLERAEALVDDLDPDTWRRVVVDALVAEARRARRVDTLGAERAAEDRRSTDPRYCYDAERYRAREARRVAEVERSRALRADLGIPLDASPDEAMRCAIQRFVADLRMEWTRELLGSTFALRDGARVTWGAATITQHQERVAMFTDLAETNLEGAARHTLAIQALQDAGAACLNDIAAAPVTA